MRGILSLVILLSSCSVVEYYSVDGESTFVGITKSENHFHEHFVDSTNNSHHCFYYHDTTTYRWKIVVDNIVKRKKLVRYKLKK
mgnify:CR=1 FL=1